MLEKFLPYLLFLGLMLVLIKKKRYNKPKKQEFKRIKKGWTKEETYIAVYLALYQFENDEFLYL